MDAVLEQCVSFVEGQGVRLLGALGHLGGMAFLTDSGLTIFSSSRTALPRAERDHVGGYLVSDLLARVRTIGR